MKKGHLSQTIHVLTTVKSNKKKVFCFIIFFVRRKLSTLSNHISKKTGKRKERKHNEIIGLVCNPAKNEEWRRLWENYLLKEKVFKFSKPTFDFFSFLFQLNSVGCEFDVLSSKIFLIKECLIDFWDYFPFNGHTNKP